MVVRSSEDYPCGSYWQGGDIKIFHNGQSKATFPSGFNEQQYCIPFQELDVKNDRFQLKASNNDGVCIQSLLVNGQQLLVGALDDQPSFWIDGNNNSCDYDKMSTSQLTIQNGAIISSACKGLTKTYKIMFLKGSYDKYFESFSNYLSPVTAVFNLSAKKSHQNSNKAMIIQFMSICFS